MKSPSCESGPKGGGYEPPSTTSKSLGGRSMGDWGDREELTAGATRQ